MTVIDRILKRDSYGGYPKWWQWLFPRYQNWGGPGWSAGKWNNDPEKTLWLVYAVDEMDALFKEHDCAYQIGADRMDADYALITALRQLEVEGLWPSWYRVGAMMIFYCHIGWLLFRGEKKRALYPDAEAA